MNKTKDVYLTPINAKTAYNEESFKDIPRTQIDVKKGDRNKTSSFIAQPAYDAYIKASEELESLNIHPTLNSAGRDIEDQQFAIEEFYKNQLGEGKTEEQAKALTSLYTAPLGHSEHHSGLALDIVGPTGGANVPDHIQQKFSDPRYAKGLKFITKRLVLEKHGFIMTYPEGARLEEATGMKVAESWHFRYIGPKHAQRIAKLREMVSTDEIVNKNKAKLEERLRKLQAIDPDITDDIIKNKVDGLMFEEVYLEDYIKLLSYDVKADSEKELLEQYAEIFKTDILGLKLEESLTC